MSSCSHSSSSTHLLVGGQDHGLAAVQATTVAQRQSSRSKQQHPPARRCAGSWACPGLAPAACRGSARTGSAPAGRPPAEGMQRGGAACANAHEQHASAEGAIAEHSRGNRWRQWRLLRAGVGARRGQIHRFVTYPGAPLADRQPSRDAAGRGRSPLCLTTLRLFRSFFCSARTSSAAPTDTAPSAKASRWDAAEPSRPGRSSSCLAAGMVSWCEYAGGDRRSNHLLSYGQGARRRRCAAAASAAVAALSLAVPSTVRSQSDSYSHLINRSRQGTQPGIGCSQRRQSSGGNTVKWKAA